MNAPSKQTTTALAIRAMHCWAPGADGAQAWQSWQQQQISPAGDTPPDLPDIKPMQRRRLSLLARCVFKAAGQCLQQVPEQQRADVVCLFANAYGQCSATARMLHNLAVTQPTSPTAFSLSVHNAIAGQFSIAYGLTAPSSTLAPGSDGLGGVLLEAAGWLRSGRCKYVLLCCFEEPVPDTLKPYLPNPPTPLAAAWLLRVPQDQDQERAGDFAHEQKNGEINIELSRESTTLAQNDHEQFGPPFWQQVLAFVAAIEGASDGDTFSIEGGRGIVYHFRTTNTEH